MLSRSVLKNLCRAGTSSTGEKVGSVFLRSLSDSARNSPLYKSTVTSGDPDRKVKNPKRKEGVIIEAGKRNIPQSPWKMNFLVKLVRNKWLPDAMAQLKFSPKMRSEEVGLIIKRAAALAKIREGAIPEELYVKEVCVTKGTARKKMTIMGRGRTGFGYTRAAHLNVKVEVIDFDSMIDIQKTHSQKQKWIQRKELAAKKKTEGSGDLGAVPIPASDAIAL